MKAWTRLAALAAIATGTVVAIEAAPASATIVTSSAGTTVTLTVTGDETFINFNCVNGQTAVSFVVVTPNVACSQLTVVTVNGDGGRQSVYGTSLDVPAFSAHPQLVTSLGAGNDQVLDTNQVDSISTGPGQDNVWIGRGPSNSNVDLGADEDSLLYEADDTTANDTIAVSSTGTFGSVSDTVAGATKTQGWTNAERLSVRGLGGNDTITGTGITAGSILTVVDFQGGEGDDALTAGAHGLFLYGGPGTNTLTGAAGNDVLVSYSATDWLAPGGGSNAIYDDDSLHIGRPNLVNTGTTNTYHVRFTPGDAVARLRWKPGSNASQVTASLTRNGQAFPPSTHTVVDIDFGQFSDDDDRGLADVSALLGNRTTIVRGDSLDNDLLDITIPSGTWTVSGSPLTDGAVNPDNPAYGSIQYSDLGSVRVHNPWIVPQQGFAFRVVRDLMFRFPTDVQREQIRTDLVNGTKTRYQVISGLMNTDEYRGLDVDRVFVKYLRRSSDPSGRTYWINSLRNGKSLLQFRAQLFGSNEYFTKSGGSNEAYMQQAYADVMGRAPDPSGKAYWVHKLDTGTDRGVVAREFLKSTEARRNIVKDQFLRFIDRYPTTTPSGESETWVTKLAAANGERDLIADLTSGEAYYNRD